MTLIEFYEKDAIENICSSIIKAPERVILVGDNLKLMQRHAERYGAILAARGVNVEFICRAISKSKIQTIIDALSKIVEEYDDCVFDLTGGEDLYLVATGIVYQKYNEERDIQMHRFNIRNDAIVDCDQDGRTILEGEAPDLTIEENIRIYGGDIIYNDLRDDTTFLWDISTDFRKDINTMWNICRQDVRLWNTQINVLEAACRLADDDEQLILDVRTDALKKEVERSGGRYVLIRRIFSGLYEAGLLLSYSCDDDHFSVKFKNEQVKYCLTVAGQILEMKVFLAAREACEKDGPLTYNDVLNGVCIDWDGDIDINQDRYDTENEIDVMMMRGMVPVFVSCKNGFIERDELYKLSVVATRFGGKYAKKVLVATALDDSDYSNYLRQRASDMGIRIVEGYSHKGHYKRFAELSDEELNALFRTLWMN